MHTLTRTTAAAAILALLPNFVTAAEDEWEFAIAPMYVWAKNIEGSAGLGPTNAPLDLDFTDDILENLDAAFAVHFEAKYNDLTLFAEYNFARLDPSAEETLGPINASLGVEFEDTNALSPPRPDLNILCPS